MWGLSRRSELTFRLRQKIRMTAVRTGMGGSFSLRGWDKIGKSWPSCGREGQADYLEVAAWTMAWRYGGALPFADKSATWKVLDFDTNSQWRQCENIWVEFEDETVCSVSGWVLVYRSVLHTSSQEGVASVQARQEMTKARTKTWAVPCKEESDSSGVVECKHSGFGCGCNVGLMLLAAV